MRIDNEFGKARKTEARNYSSKAFIISEGYTEVKYFSNLNKSVLTENIEIINILRDYAMKGNSHSNHLIEIYKEFLLNSKGYLTIKELKGKIENYDRDNGYNRDLEKIFKELDKNFASDEYELSLEDLGTILFEVFRDEIYKDFIPEFIDYFNNQNVTYNPDIDSLNLVIDRDSGNFDPDQYDNIVVFCHNNNIKLYVSNPCFEFWLLLHFSQIYKISKKMIAENPKVSSKRRFLEKELHSICGYTKRKYNFKIFEPHINEAIENEKDFCEEIEELKNNIGSNVGLLVSELISK